MRPWFPNETQALPSTEVVQQVEEEADEPMQEMEKIMDAAEEALMSTPTKKVKIVVKKITSRKMKI